MAGFAPAQELVYLPDVAALEWAYHRAHFDVDEAELDVATLTQLPHSQLEYIKLHVQPACRVLASPYPVSAIWRAHQAGADRDFQIGLDSCACIALVCRTGRAVQIAELSEAEADWLFRIDNGQALGVATTATLARYPSFELQASLLKLVALQLFTNSEIGAAS